MEECKEYWRTVKNFENVYEISNYGRLKSITRFRKGRDGALVFVKEKIRKGRPDKDGYIEYALCVGKHKKMKFFRAHRLVAEAFLPNPDNLPIINHKDENPANNFVWVNEDGTVDIEKSNLEWCDYKYNRNYSIYKVSHSILIDGKIFPSVKEGMRLLGIDFHNRLRKNKKIVVDGHIIEYVSQ